MLRTAFASVFAILCLTSLTSCGMKGPLYLPERTPTPAPTSSQAPAMPSEPGRIEATSPFEEALEEANDTNGAQPAAGGMQSSTRLAP